MDSLQVITALTARINFGTPSRLYCGSYYYKLEGGFKSCKSALPHFPLTILATHRLKRLKCQGQGRKAVRSILDILNVLRDNLARW